MIRVRAASRLHFGLLSLSWADPAGWRPLPPRYFGGVGLMVEHPGIELAVRGADNWSAQGPGAERALAFGRRVCQSLNVDQAFAFDVERCPPEHVGLGTGTQLGLAVARALALATGHAQLTAKQLAEACDRGKRSALGIHGFEQGGLLVDGGKNVGVRIAPLVCRCEFPADWSLLLIVPKGLTGTHGSLEQDAFDALRDRAAGLRDTETLCRLVLLGLLPALVERDLDQFSRALHEFNRRVGELFRSWQGGIYSHPKVAAIIKWLRTHAVVEGAGQSSWGPSIFAVKHRDEWNEPGWEWHDVMDGLQRDFGLGTDEMIITRAANHGAISEQTDEP